MEYQRVFDKLFGQKTKLKILRYLVKNPIEQSGRQIAKNTEIAHRQCHKVLQELYGQGILGMRHIGNAYLYNLRKEHYLVEKVIKPFFEAESQLIKDLVAEIKKIKTEDIISIGIFGSIPKGKEKPHSDIDILVVINRDINKEKIAELIRSKNEYFISRFGNSLAPYIVAEKEFVSRYKKGDKLIKNIIKNGEVISGKTFGELVTG